MWVLAKVPDQQEAWVAGQSGSRILIQRIALPVVSVLHSSSTVCTEEAPADICWWRCGLDPSNPSPLPELVLLVLFPSGSLGFLSTSSAWLASCDLKELLGISGGRWHRLQIVERSHSAPGRYLLILRRGDAHLLLPRDAITTLLQNRELTAGEPYILLLEQTSGGHDAVVTHVQFVPKRPQDPPTLLRSLLPIGSANRSAKVLDYAAQTLGISRSREGLEDLTVVDCSSREILRLSRRQSTSYESVSSDSAIADVPTERPRRRSLVTRLTSLNNVMGRSSAIATTWEDSHIVTFGAAPFIRFGVIEREVRPVKKPRRLPRLPWSLSVRAEHVPYHPSVRVLGWEGRVCLLARMFGDHEAELVVPCPWKPELVAIRDSLARVILLWVPGQRVIKWWKGYRAANLAWAMTGASADERHTTLLMVVPGRGLFEVWKIGGIVSKIRGDIVPKGTQLLDCREEDPYENSQVTLLIHDEEIRALPWSALVLSEDPVWKMD